MGERKTEKLLSKAFEEAQNRDSHLPRAPCVVEEQGSDNPEIQKLLRGASKRTAGHQGFPDYIISSSVVDDLVIVMECKADSAKHRSNTLDKYSDYAIDGALNYAYYLSKGYKNVIAIGASGQSKEEFQMSTYHIRYGEPPKDLNINTALPFSDYVRIVQNDPDVLASKYRGLLNSASSLHNYMRDYGKLNESEKPLVVSGILIALTHRPFAAGYIKKAAAKSLAVLLYNTIKSVLMEADLTEDKINVMMQPYSFIKVHEQLTKGDTLRDIIAAIDKEIKPFMESYFDSDILGQFYGEFLKYVGGDKKGLGIVLTPKHITQLFVELAKVTRDTVLLDICAGTGGFLIAGMHSMIKQANGDPKIIDHIKKHQLIGIEQQANMFALATANMILRGDGSANLYLGSCFDEKLQLAVSYHRPTAGIINPSYSQKDFSELKFVIAMLDRLESGSLGVAVIPMSCVINKHRDKEELLKRHTLEAVMSLPDDLFYPVGVVTCCVVFTTGRPHPKGYETWFGYWKDDGLLKTRTMGRYDKYNRWKKIEAEWLDSYMNRKVVPDKSVLRYVSASEEWCAEAYIETGCDPLTISEGLLTSIKNHQLWLARSASKMEAKITASEWKDFRYTDIFELENGKLNYPRELLQKEGRTPLIGSSAINNGLAGYIDEDPDYKSGCITISIRGGGQAFYQEEDFSASINALVLKPKFKMNRYRGLFLCNVINLECYKFCYGRIRTMGRVLSEAFKLPATKDGKIDWGFIEEHTEAMYKKGRDNITRRIA